MRRAIAIAGLILVAGGGVPQTSHQLPHDATVTAASGVAYQAPVAADGHGQPETLSTTTSTVTPSGPATTTELHVRDGHTVGVAMPITVAFDEDIPPEARLD